MRVFCIGLILIFAYKITLTYQSDELIKITIPNEKLGDYFRVLEKYESIIDEITNPRYIFGDENHKKINAKWLITKSKSDLIERELKERDIDFTLVSQVATTKHKRNSRQKRDVNNEDSAKIRTKEDCISRYYCLDQVYEWMRYITQKYPKIAEIVEVGESFHNRKLLALKLGYPNKEANKPLFWFDSAVHAREWTTINSVMFTIMNVHNYFKQILEELNKSDSLMAKFLNRYDIYFLVVGNPDGYEYSYKVNNMWRKNMRDYNPHQKCFGVDLNRNFELFSKTGGKSSPCASDYKGTEPGSEPETHAIQKFILDRAPRWLSFISIHAFGAFWILNREEENFPNKNEFINHCEKALFSLKRIKQLNNKDFKFGTPKSLLGYSVSGATDTWAQMRAGAKYAFSIEIGPSESENDILIDGLGFHIDEDNIKQVAKTIYDGLYTYLSTFIDSIPYNERSEIRTFCSNEYENIKKNS